MLKTLATRTAAAAAVLASTGCASIVNDSTHPMRVETKTASGDMVNGAECRLSNDCGAIIDHNKGTAYTYPTWVQLVFGRSLVFDRTAEKQGMPVLGTEPVASK